MMITFNPYIFGALLLLGIAGLPAEGKAQSNAVITKVVVHAVSQDAKILQDPVGGARITIREKATGRILARGIQRGGSGNTEMIMKRPHERGETTYNTPGAAKYVAHLRLTRPTVVKITAEGPLAYPQAMQKTSKTMLLVPGHDIVGDGVVLTLHGFIVDIQSPEQVISVQGGNTVDVRASVRMMCGCSVTPGGLWDANEIAIEARLLGGGEVLRTIPLTYSGEQSIYEGTITVPEEGQFELQVLAMDAQKVNFGIDRRQVVVKE